MSPLRLRDSDNKYATVDGIAIRYIVKGDGSPVVLIHGAQDRVIPVENARNACKLLPQARLEVFEKCGHVPHLEKATEFNEAVIAFLDSDQSV